MAKTLEDKNAELKTKFLEYFSILPIQKLAAESIGRSEDTITDWKKKDPIFSDQVARARAEWAKSKASRVRSNEWLLERIMKDHFAPRQEVTGAEGEKLQIEIIETNKDE